MALSQTNRNLFDRLAAIEAAVLGDGLLCVDRANKVYVKTGSGAPTDGAEGTGVGVCGPGSLYVDYTNAKLYVQTGAIGNVYWLVAGTQASA